MPALNVGHILELYSALVFGAVGSGIAPFSGYGFDEALSLTIGTRGEEAGRNMAPIGLLKGMAKDAGLWSTSRYG